MPNLITAENIALIRNNRLLFKNLNFSLKAGEMIHLIGENGSGKTSFLQALAGLLPPDKGRITRNCDLIYLGHQAGINPNFTVQENLLFSAQIYHGLRKKEALSYIDQALETLELSAYANFRAKLLSEGQKRRIQLARLWLPSPKLWLLDEPLASLDDDTITRLLKHCEAHIVQQGGIVMTSHQAFSLKNQGVKKVLLSDLIS